MPAEPAGDLEPAIGQGDADVVYGQLRIGGIDVALPLTAVREAVPCPATFPALPTAVPGLMGAMNLRRLVLPVMDLRQAIGGASDPGAEQVVVVVAHEGQVLGLLAEEVRGVVRVPTSSLLAMATTSATLLFSHTFRHPVSGEVLSILDAEKLVHLAGVPTVSDPGYQEEVSTVPPPAGEVSGSATASRTVMLARCGTHLLAVDVADVHTTVPSTAERPSVLSSTLCRGVIDFQQLEVPVIDPLVLLGLGQMPATTMGAGLVLNAGSGYVVLALSELLDLTVLAAEAVLPLASFALNRPSLIAGVAVVDEVGQCLVLDGPGVLTASEVTSLASVNTSLEEWSSSVGDLPTSSVTGGATSPSASAGALAAAAGPHLTFSAGVDVVTPLHQVIEILPLPTGTTPTEVGGAVRAVMVHRGHAMPVLCLASILGREPLAEGLSSCVLVVAVDGDHVAFVIDGLHAISPLEWVDPESRAGRGEHDGHEGHGIDPGRILAGAPLVRVKGGDRLLPDLDLEAIARMARGVSAAPSDLGLVLA